MMRVFGTVLVAAGLSAWLACSAPAQDPLQGGREPGSYDGILQFAVVQKELKLNEDQLFKVREVMHDVRQRHRGELEHIKLPLQEPSAKGRDIFKKISEETRQGLDAVLRPEQLKRLDQIHVQLAGIQAFSDPRVEKALRLTEEQKRQIRTIRGEASRGFSSSPRGNLTEILKKATVLRKELVQKAVAVLTPSQRQAWKELTGEPFEIKIEPRYLRPPAADKESARPGPD